VFFSYSDWGRRRAAWRAKANSFGSGALWRYAQNVGPARAGAVTHPGGEAETRCYADV
jgi:dihydroxy-acid dehydratase